MKRVVLTVCFAVLSMFAALPQAQSADLLAADTADGYAGKVLALIAPHWKASVDGQGRISRAVVRIGIDGRVLSCSTVESSGNEALDSSLCAAVAAVDTFPTPAYGAVAEVHLALSSGEAPKKLTPAEYAGVVQARITPFLHLPSKALGEFTALVRIMVDERGTITKSVLERGTGNKEVDAVIMQAVQKAGVMPPPPSEAAQEILLNIVLRTN